MTVTYDPHHPMYLDEADTRVELARVFDTCHSCRRCVELCPSFPTLFGYIDRHVDLDAGRMTPFQQDHVVDQCFQCKLCYVNCPYIPGQHESAIDFPRLMLRAAAMRRSSGRVTLRDKVTSAFLGSTDAIGALAVVTVKFTNKVIGAKPGSLIRKAVEVTTGVSSVRLLPMFARERFSAWFKKRPRVRVGKRQGRVTVFPTCLVEYQEPTIGKALVKVYEHNGIECSLTTAGCCGAPYLHSGDMAKFTKIAVDNVAALAAEVRRGTDIVVPQPTCGFVLKKDYLDYVGGPDALLVSQHTYDAAEYLMKVHATEGLSLDTDFDGPVPETITYHTPCHLLAQNIGLKSRDLMKLTGARIKIVQQCSGIDGLWGLRAENAELSIPIGKKLAAMVKDANGDVVAGDCHLANTVITEQSGVTPLHPLQVVARAYGLDTE
ncbi:MAG: heterodisulfide reductase-related iron-sulfur binding cluster [Ilumatobacteraceae bacterium]